MAEGKGQSIWDKLGPGSSAGPASAQKRLVRGPGGQLQDITGEEVQTLSSKLGQQVPSTPLGGASMGVSPDQAKMLSPGQSSAVGSARQRAASALDIGMGGESQVSQARRTEQARAQATGAEQQKLEKSQTLQNMGGLGDRVHGLIQKKFSEMTFKPSAEELPEEQRQQELMQWADTAGVPRDQVVAKLNEGKDPATIAAELQSELQAGTAAAGAGAAVDYQDIQVDDQFVSELGFGSAQELSDLLGRDVTGMTVDQLQSAVDAAVQQEYTQAQELRELLNDPSASPALREEARRALRDMGAVGTLSAEDQAEDIAAAVAAADTIEVGGREMTVEELLSDENMESVISEYVALDEKARAELVASNPELASVYDWVEQHEDAIAGAVEQTKGTAQTLTEERNKRVEKLQGSGINPELLRKLYPDYDSFGDIGEPPTVLKQLQSASNPADLASKLNDIESIDPDLMGELASADEEALRSMGLLGDNTEENRQRWTETKAVLSAISSGTIEDLATSFGIEPIEMQAELGYLLSTDAIDEGLSRILDADGDNSIDNWAEVSSRLREIPPQAIASLGSKLLESSRSNRLDEDIDKITGKYADVDDVEQFLNNNRGILPLEKIGRLQQKVGEILSDEATKLSKSNITGILENNPPDDQLEVALSGVDRDLKTIVDKLEDPRLPDDAPGKIQLSDLLNKLVARRQELFNRFDKIKKSRRPAPVSNVKEKDRGREIAGEIAKAGGNTAMVAAKEFKKLFK